MKRALLAGALVGLVAALLVVALRRDSTATTTSWPIPGEAGPRIEVEVLNGAGIDGLARSVTAHLRRAGLDVVSFGTAAEVRDSTLILVRRGDTAAARAVQGALGLGRIELAPDPRLLLDVSVVLGGDAALIGRDP